MENKDNRIVRIYLDDEKAPLAEYKPPVKMVLDTTKLTDGDHELRVVARSTMGREGVKKIPFKVRNGPAITVVGLENNDVVDHDLPITINAYGHERPDMFVVTGSETPLAIPAWVWMLIIAFIAWGIYFLIRYFTPEHYLSSLFIPMLTGLLPIKRKNKRESSGQ